MYGNGTVDCFDDPIGVNLHLNLALVDGRYSYIIELR
jgi:hypothetical protein